MVEVKVCGMMREEDIFYANELQPDYVGFIFAPSRRQITVEKAMTLVEKLDKKIKKVGVFVNPSMKEVAGIAKACGLDVLQFHGDEKPQEINFPLYEVWKSFRIKDSKSIEKLEDYSVEGYLLDTYVKGMQGGTGKAFNWDIVSEVAGRKPIILAGGLTPENLQKAIMKVRPKVVDVSSGIETNGYKDFNKMKIFIEKARRSYDV